LYIDLPTPSTPLDRNGLSGAGSRVDLIDYWAKEIRRLEIEIVNARQTALNKRARTSYFVFFTSQKDAAIAAQTKLHPEDGHSFQISEAPGPEEVWSFFRRFFLCRFPPPGFLPVFFFAFLEKLLFVRRYATLLTDVAGVSGGSGAGGGDTLLGRGVRFV
jgi:hypothetical protein